MKIAVLLPSKEALDSAGARIRYERLAAALEKQGSALRLIEIASFDARGGDFDALVVSKCYDARALVIAELAARRGAIVGVDLFDDYFSQRADSRLTRFRSWLEQMLAIADFATCSTEAMVAVVKGYRCDLPVQLVSDPAPPVNAAALGATLEQKLAAARAERRLRLCWFGMGDNPHFPVGLTDVRAFADALAPFAAHGIAAELSILTNPRALDARGLAAIAGLPLPTRVEQWSQTREDALLRDSFACFLPVNAQGFSVAKSNNRAVTALAAGCQLLSPGFPLYADFERFIYRSGDELAADFAAGRMRFGPEEAGRAVERLEEIASPQAEARSLVDFLGAVEARRRPRAERSAPLIVVHGAATTGAAHALAQAGGGLSVAAPFCSAPLEFDAVFEARAGGDPVLLVSRKALSRLRPEQRRAAAPFGRIGRRKFWQVGGRRKKEEASFDWAEPALPLQLALYDSTMRSIFDQLDASFGPGRTILSETSPLPFRTAR
jgi:hypothetical protein